MFNPLSLFAPIKALVEYLRSVDEISIDGIEDVNHTHAKRKLDAKGACFRFSRRSKIFARKQQGWKIFQQRDWTGKPSTFVDRYGDTVLMYKLGPD